jgi:hypothetical protein
VALGNSTIVSIRPLAVPAVFSPPDGPGGCGSADALDLYILTVCEAAVGRNGKAQWNSCQSLKDPPQKAGRAPSGLH